MPGRFLLPVTLLLVTLSCASVREAARPVDSASTETEAVEEEVVRRPEIEQMLAEADRHWRERERRESLDAAIALYAEAVTELPRSEQARLFERLARAEYLLADAHLGRGSASRTATEQAYQRAMDWGERCFEISPGYMGRIQAGSRMDEAVSALEPPYVGCLYWVAAATWRWAMGEGFAMVVASRQRVLRLIERTREIEPGWFYGGPDRLLGVYFASLPTYLGRDRERSERHLLRAMERAPAYLGTRVVMAETLEELLRERRIYRLILDEVLSADAEADPEIAPENRLAQRRAAELLAGESSGSKR